MVSPQITKAYGIPESKWHWAWGMKSNCRVYMLTGWIFWHIDCVFECYRDVKKKAVMDTIKAWSAKKTTAGSCLTGLFKAHRILHHGQMDPPRHQRHPLAASFSQGMLEGMIQEQQMGQSTSWAFHCDDTQFKGWWNVMVGEVRCETHWTAWKNKSYMHAGHTSDSEDFSWCVIVTDRHWWIILWLVFVRCNNTFMKI